MVDLKMQRPQVSAQQLGLVRVIAGVVLLALAAWLGWRGVELVRDAEARGALAAARDTAAQEIAGALRAETKRMQEQMAQPEFVAAIAARDFVEAARMLPQGWPGASAASVSAADRATVRAQPVPAHWAP